MFPSYVFVEMIVTEKSWFIVRNTPKVTGFLGSSGKGAKPVPLPPDEINGILRAVGLMSKPVYDFNVGDKVLVISGAFADKVLEIVAVNEEREIVTALVEFLGRPSPTEFSYSEVKKVENQE
jgi:transcriptional antiterminator NusG